MLNPAFLLPLGAYHAELPPEPDMPIELRTMLEAAMASGNDGDVATVVKYARRAAPKHSQQIADIDIATPEPEFRAWRWAEPADLPTMIVPFKKTLYEAVLAAFSSHLHR